MSENILDQLMPGEAIYPRNQWYVAGYSDELDEGPLARTLLDTPVVMYRTEKGEPAALFDRCPHRGIQLSRGKVVNDRMQCPYHGMEFNTEGVCKKIPSSAVIPDRMKVDSYPLVDSWHYLWIWMGDPDKADENLIPDLSVWGFQQQGWYSRGALLLPTPGNYLMPFENFLDASHISFLHGGQLDQGNVAFVPFTTEIEGNWVKVHREIAREKQSALTIKVFGFSGEYARREIIAECYVPSMCGIRVNLTPLNEALDQPAGETMTNQLAIGITPETRSSCHQFTAVSQNFPFPEGIADNNKGLRDLLMQDVVAMENIQQTFDRIKPEERVEFSVKADEPAMRARRMIAKMIEDERKES